MASEPPPDDLLFWQFKHSVVDLKDMNEFVGATLGRVQPGSVLRVRCIRATKPAKARAAAENARGVVSVIIEELGE